MTDDHASCVCDDDAADDDNATAADDDSSESATREMMECRIAAPAISFHTPTTAVAAAALLLVRDCAVYGRARAAAARGGWVMMWVRMRCCSGVGVRWGGVEERAAHAGWRWVFESGGCWR